MIRPSLRTSAPCIAAIVTALIITATLLLHATVASSTPANSWRTIRDTIDLNLTNSHYLLQHLPKADLHNHLTGACYAEVFIQIASDFGLCVNTTSLYIVKCTSVNDSSILEVSKISKESSVYQDMLRAMSMTNFAYSNDTSKPDQFYGGLTHFFDAFRRFGLVTDMAETVPHAEATMLSQVIRLAASSGVMYLETMTSLLTSTERDDVQSIFPSWPDRDVMSMTDAEINNLLSESQRYARSHGMDRIVQKIMGRLHDVFAATYTMLGCSNSHVDTVDWTPQVDPCDVIVNFLAYGDRTLSPKIVFLQLLIGAETALAQQSQSTSQSPSRIQQHRVVGLNLVDPENNPLSLSQYDFHMKVLKWFHQTYPSVPISVHAGELVPGLPGTTARDLTNHIEEAVSIAGVQRIGHGVDISFESNPENVTMQMQKNGVSVEINLVSNEQILRINATDGDHAPFNYYRRAGVPVVLCTDDEGVERTNLLSQYLLALSTYTVEWTQFIDIARTGLAASFLSGESIFKWVPSTQHPPFYTYVPTVECLEDLSSDSLSMSSLSPSCAALVAVSEKAFLQITQEIGIRKLESRVLLDKYE